MMQYPRANNHARGSNRRLLTRILSCSLCLLQPRSTWDHKYWGRWMSTFSSASLLLIASSLCDCVWWFVGNHVWKIEHPFCGSTTFSPLLFSLTPTFLGEWGREGWVGMIVVDISFPLSHFRFTWSGTHPLFIIVVLLFLKWYTSFFCQLSPSYLPMTCFFLQISFPHLVRTLEALLS